MSKALCAVRNTLGFPRFRGEEMDHSVIVRRQHHFEASIEEVIVGKRVMRQSLFADETLALSEANPVAATALPASPLVAYALPGAALLVALAALAVALLK